MIIIEGHDNSGKSTLAKHIAQHVGWDIKESEGPPKSKTELADRIERYYSLSHTIFVRHPCVSEMIYGPITRPLEPSLNQAQLDKFYSQANLFIYCDPLDRGLLQHNIKPNEAQQHLDGVQQNYATILGTYRLWAIGKAHVCYRIGDNMDDVVGMIRGWFTE